MKTIFHQLLLATLFLFLTLSSFVIPNCEEEDRNQIPFSTALSSKFGTGSGTGSGCPPNYTGVNQLVGVQIVDSHFETFGAISSDQLLTTGISVEYDAADCIELLPGFEVSLGAELHAYIDGCSPEIP